MTEDPGFRDQTRERLTNLENGVQEVLALVKAVSVALANLIAREDESTAALKAKDTEQDRRLDALEGVEPPDDPPPPESPFTLVRTFTFEDDAGLGIYGGARQLADQGPRIPSHVECVRDAFVPGPSVRLHTRPALEPHRCYPGPGSDPYYDVAEGEYASAGFAAGPDLLYGAWEWTMAASSAAVVRVCPMLWPKAGEGWPPEFNVIEMGGDKDHAGRQIGNVALHWRSDTGRPPHPQDIRAVHADWTQPHRVRVEWTTDLITVQLDGVEVERFDEHVPDVPMHFAAQTAIEGGSPADEDIEAGWLDLADLQVSRYTP